MFAGLIVLGCVLCEEIDKTDLPSYFMRALIFFWNPSLFLEVRVMFLFDPTMKITRPILPPNYQRLSSFRLIFPFVFLQFRTVHFFPKV